MSAKRKGTGWSAAEIVASLAANPDYQRKIAADEASRQARAEEFGRAEQPVLADLRAAGVHVGSVWDLVNSAAPYPSGLPILLEHLRRGGYPDRVMESLGRALAVRSSAPWWEHLRALFLKAQGPGEAEGLALALAASATSEHLDRLIELLQGKGDPSRLHLLRAIKRVGGQRGSEVLESLLDDPEYGTEARALLKRRR